MRTLRITKLATIKAAGHLAATLILSLPSFAFVLTPAFADTPPETTASLSPSPNSQGNYPNPVTISLSATASSGATVAATYITVDWGARTPDSPFIQRGSAQFTYSVPIEVYGNGTHTITYWSVDSTRVVENQKALTFTINSPPHIQFNQANPPSFDAGEGQNAFDSNSTGLFTDLGSNSWTGTVDFGDGSGVQPLTFSGTFNPHTVVAATNFFFPNHIYQDDATYTITVSITDEAGVTGVASTTANVTGYSVSPGGITAPSSVSLNSTFTASANVFDAGIPDSSASWDWGDGTSSQGVVTQTYNPGATFNGTVSGSHAYHTVGTYNATLSMTDDDDFRVGRQYTTISVVNTNQPPSVSALPNISINNGDTYSVSGSFTDSDSSSWTATVNYGDGSGTLPLTFNGMNFSLSRTYSAVGSYTVTVSITDNQGATGSGTSTVTVNAPILQINSGGGSAGSFVADTDVSGGSTYSSSLSVDNNGASNPAPTAVYQTVRYGNFTYTIPNLTPNTNYLVRLHFNELYWGTTNSGNQGGIGSRVFNVDINGSQVLNNFDILLTANGANKADIEEFVKPADTNGNLIITFSTVNDNAMVSGIEIDQPTSYSPHSNNPQPQASVSINSGGTTSGNFLSDRYYSGGTSYSSSATVDKTGVTNPAPQAVYQSSRYGNMTYSITNLIPNASYTARLHFNELYWGTSLSGNSGGVGSRVFNVSLNGTQVLSNFDIYQTAGGANKALVEQFTTNADVNGVITIVFTTVTDNALINGIELSH